MALRYICLFSARPSINDQAKWSSHRSQAALICHYSALIGWISTSLPVRRAGGEMSGDKQPKQPKFKVEGESGRHAEWRNGGEGVEEKGKIKIQGGGER